MCKNNIKAAFLFLFMAPVVDSMWTVCGMPQQYKLWAVRQLQAWPAEPRVPETHMPEKEMHMSHSQGKLMNSYCLF